LSNNPPACPGTCHVYFIDAPGTVVELAPTHVVQYVVLPVIALAETFANLYEMKWKNIITRHDNLALARAIAFRNQLDATTMDARLLPAGLTWDGTNFAVPIANSDTSLFIAKMKAAMEASYLNYHGQYDVITDLQTSVSFENYMNQGTGNYSNTQWQFSDVNFHKTQQSISTAFGRGAVLAMPKGSLAGLLWNEKLNREGLHQDPGGSIGELGTLTDPFGLGITADVSTYMQRADTSANIYGGSPQDFVQQLELTVTIGYATDPSSTTNDSPIIMFGQNAGII